MADEPQALVGRRILVVDDQAPIRRLLEAGLADWGAEVWTALDGAAALHMLETLEPDLILLDLSMPAVTGWEVLEALRASRHAGVPVILETSADDFESFDRARKLGVAAFISKPFRLGEVVETCRRVLDGAVPLEGRAPSGGGLPLVQLRDSAGTLLSTGRLLDLAPTGAQVDIDRPLTPGQQVILTVQVPEGPIECPAEVRWVTRAGGGFQHGLAIRP
ncbi:MAG TPA: response regulator [Vicinamibacteria bacterium]|nr:response regulator [Vicinamibacteria bacterium]